MAEVGPFLSGQGPFFLSPAPLRPEHDIGRFDCGKEALNVWLQNRALKSEGRSARTYVVCRSDGPVVGYYALATGSVIHDGAPSALKRNMPDPVPVMVLARLAVDRQHHGRGLGGGLLRDALLRAFAISQEIGASAVLVHAIDNEAIGFYAGYGFKPFPTDPRTLFLPIDHIAAAEMR